MITNRHSDNDHSNNDDTNNNSSHSEHNDTYICSNNKDT